MGTKVIYIGTKPEPGTTSLHGKYRTYDQLIWNLTVNNDNASLVMIDSYGAFESMGNPNSLYDDDNLHLSESGYAYWNEWVNIALNATDDCRVWRAGVCVGNETLARGTSGSITFSYSCLCLFLSILLSL